MENSEAVVPKGRKSKAESKPSQSLSPKPEKQEPPFQLSEVQQSARERGQRDLFFFCKEILQYKDMIERVHQSVCDLYGPPPDLTKPFQDQDTIHNYLLLDPRGEFKTSISMGKTLQNYVNFPEVCTLRMSGKEETVKAMIKEAKDQILTNTTFRELFPEHVPWSGKKGEEGLPPSDFGSVFGFTNPARQRPRREPSVGVSTLESVKASTHYEWITGDDLVHEKNYQTKELLRKTITDWKLARNLLNPRGYRELVGTRYDWSDLYGEVIEKNKGEWRIHDRPIWTYDLRFALGNGFLVPPDYKTGDLIFLHPERWTFNELSEIQEEDQFLFNCQRLNSPIPPGNENFPEQELVRHTIQRHKYPDTGMLSLFLMWHFNLADPLAEDPVGVVGGWDHLGRLFVVDLVRGPLRPSQIIAATIEFWMRWPIQRIAFEDSKKQRLLEAGLMAKFREARLTPPIDWVKFGGNQHTEEDQINDILGLEPLLRANKLWFHDELPKLRDLYVQFKQFPTFRLRGIPRAISRLMHYRTQSTNITAQTVYGSELYSPALSWDRTDEDLGAGLVG